MKNNIYRSDIELLELILEQLEIISKKLSTNPKTNAATIGYIDNVELMKLLHISERTANEWRRRGTLKFKRIHNKIYYNVEDVKQMLKTN